MSGSSNFLQHNPGLANQENDAAYSADSLRTGGIGTDDILPSVWLNKVWYQSSIFCAAFAGALANKGYTVSDANFAALEAVFANVLTQADVKNPMLVVAYSGTPFFNAAVANGFQITLTGDATGSMADWTPGQIMVFVIIQDSAGGHSFSIPGVHNWQPVNQAANSVTVQTIIARADNTLWSDGQIIFPYNVVQSGTGIGQTGTANATKIGWSGSRLKATVDITDLGNIVFDSQLNADVASLTSSIAGVTSALNAFEALFTSNLSGNGNLKIPLSGGQELIVQWCVGPGNTSDQTVLSFNFPLAFPNACLWANITAQASGTDYGEQISFSLLSFTRTTISYYFARNSDHGGMTPIPVVIAIGY